MIYSAIFNGEAHYARADDTKSARMIFVRSFRALARAADPECDTPRITVAQIRKIGERFTDAIPAPGLLHAINTAPKQIIFRAASGKVSDRKDWSYNPTTARDTARRNILASEYQGEFVRISA